MLWTGQLQPSCAPDVPLAGVAALAPASDLTGLVENLGTVAAYVATAYSQIYPDVSFNRLIRPEAQAQVRGYACRCLAEPEVFVSIVSSLLADKPIFATVPPPGPPARACARTLPPAASPRRC